MNGNAETTSDMAAQQVATLSTLTSVNIFLIFVFIHSISTGKFELHLSVLCFKFHWKPH